MYLHARECICDTMHHPVHPCVQGSNTEYQLECLFQTPPNLMTSFGPPVLTPPLKRYIHICILWSRDGCNVMQCNTYRILLNVYTVCIYMQGNAYVIQCTPLHPLHLRGVRRCLLVGIHRWSPEVLVAESTEALHHQQQRVQSILLHGM